MTAHVVEQFRGKRPRADPGGIGLDDAQHAVDGRRTHAGSGGGAPDGRIGRGDERVGPQIDIKHRALGAFEEHAAIASLHLLQQSGHVGNKRLHPFGKTGQATQFLVQGHRLGRVVLAKQEIVQIEQVGQPLAQLLRLEQVRQAQRPPRRLVFVGGTDTPPGGTDGLGTERPLPRMIQRLVRGKDQGTRRRQPETLIHGNALVHQPVHLVHQRFKTQHHAVADHAVDPGSKDAGRNQVQNGPFAVDDQRMPGIVPSLEANHGVGTLGKQIHDGALALIAPLRADYDDVSAQRLSPNDIQQNESDNGKDESEAPELTVVHLADGSHTPAPRARRREGEQTLEDQEKRNAG